MKKLSRKEIKTRLLNIPKDVECGYHSGFPTCCIKYYITIHVWRTVEELHKYWKRVEKVSAALGRQPGYVVCDECLKRKRFIKQVKRCPEDSRCWGCSEHA